MLYIILLEDILTFGDSHIDICYFI